VEVAGEGLQVTSCETGVNNTILTPQLKLLSIFDIDDEAWDKLPVTMTPVRAVNLDAYTVTNLEVVDL